MADTLSKFIKFIVEDPIMLGLCIAIGILVILFLAVLFLGKKSDDKETTRSNRTVAKENDVETFKTDINMEPVVTDDIKPLSNLDFEPSEDIPVLIEDEGPVPELIDEIPVTLEENPVALEIPKKEEPVSTPVMPNFPSFDEIKIKDEPTIGNAVTSNREERPLPEKVRTPSSAELNDIQVIESRINPIDEKRVEETPIKDDFEVSTFEPRMETASFPSINLDVEEKSPYSEDEINDFVELPTMNVPDFSKTEIIRHIPTMEKPSEPIYEEKKVEEEDDELDIDLPKLITNTETSVMTTLKGESFNIK